MSSYVASSSFLVSEKNSPVIVIVSVAYILFEIGAQFSILN